MTIEKILLGLFDKSVLDYFKHKQRGGQSNQDGNRYENFFAVSQLIELFYILLNNTNATDIQIYIQADAFVDDLLIVDEQHSSYRHFQLKNAQQLSWGNGLKSLADDFYKQKQINVHQNIQYTALTLVCSQPKAFEKLVNNIPTEIMSFSKVIYFPVADTLNQLILSHVDFKESLEKICFSNESDKLEALAILILGHWQDKQTTVNSVHELLRELQAKFPNYLIKNNLTIDSLLPQVRAIFAEITDFSYNIQHGYFHWNYMNLESGVVLYPIDSNEFNNIQRTVIAQYPRHFDDLVGILLL
ncbi:hypothetical protein BegalDRAFT_2348 [Beggiatoa alba B18LD]|uniref:CD-NTase associated protein 4-like DNA endonuclease domain-containing protein n=1 Tax=Beggiatoa alba B18LD TaxID=395493 RepID=I3CHV9_9GAMM|nr:hypothetical protein [Beggiatoa alba]EIJ43202.1 hypothetical protein BegalDRAFT_2348 [Beggiatoa alba B18LD]